MKSDGVLRLFLNFQDKSTGFSKALAQSRLGDLRRLLSGRRGVGATGGGKQCCYHQLKRPPVNVPHATAWSVHTWAHTHTYTHVYARVHSPGAEARTASHIRWVDSRSVPPAGSSLPPRENSRDQKAEPGQPTQSDQHWPVKAAGWNQKAESSTFK